MIHAQNLSERAVLEGIKAGHVFIDTEGTTDRGIEFEARTDLDTASMGDSIHAAAQQKVHFSIKMAVLQGAHIEVIEDGRSTRLIDQVPCAEAAATKGFDYVSDGQRHWFRINIRSTSDSLLIVGNPIYLNF